MSALRHQYIDRESGALRDERFLGDGFVRALYHGARERAPILFRALTNSRTTSLLAALNYDLPFGDRLGGGRRFLSEMGVDLNECLDYPNGLETRRKVFERKIRYWDCRPMPEDPDIVVSPCDARAAVGSLGVASRLFIKDKFFDLNELLGRRQWIDLFRDADFALFRLTPEKYHYNHAPVAGKVIDFYGFDGAFHSCNPTAALALAEPYSKNRRVVTVIDTDVPGGSWVGFVAMVEVVALMIGDIVQCYSDARYDDPEPVAPGLVLRKGQVKSLFRPGSSTVVLLFQSERVRFADDLLANQRRPGVASRFANGLGPALVETDLRVRSPIGRGERMEWN